MTKTKICLVYLSLSCEAVYITKFFVRSHLKTWKHTPGELMRFVDTRIKMFTFLQAIRDEALRQCMEFDDEESEIFEDEEDGIPDDDENVDFDLVEEFNGAAQENVPDAVHDIISRSRSSSWEVVHGGDIVLVGPPSVAEEQLRYSTAEHASVNENSQLMAAEDLNILAVADESMLEGGDDVASTPTTVRDNIEHLHDEYSSAVDEEKRTVHMPMDTAQDITADIVSGIIDSLQDENEERRGDAPVVPEVLHATATIDENIGLLSGEYAKENWRHDERRLSEDFDSAPEELAALTEHLRKVYTEQINVEKSATKLPDKIEQDDDVEELLQDMSTPQSRVRALSADLSYETPSPVNAPESPAPVITNDSVNSIVMTASPNIHDQHLAYGDVMNHSAQDQMNEEDEEWKLSHDNEPNQESAVNNLGDAILSVLRESRDALVQQQQIKEV